jgi:signal transduction histidine kinase
LTVIADLKMIQRTVTNLLDNAIKYTPAPGRIDIRLFHDSKNDGTVVLSIQDSGVGIHPDDLPKIFDRFFRCDQSRATGGSGLGLSLAQAIARAHGGRIHVESVLGEGSTFTLTLPSGR